MKMALIIPLALIAPFILFFFWATYPWDLGTKMESGEIGKLVDGIESLERPSTLNVVTWNMAYAYGLGSEGTDDYQPKSEEEYAKNLEGIGGLLKQSQADVVFLQEIDFGSARSHRVDQLKRLAEMTGLPYYAYAVSWRTQYVPFPYWPFNRQFGKMSSGGAVLSRWPIVANDIHLLSKPQSKAWWYNLFYLYRYFQVVTVKVIDRDVKFINLHLEAFDQGTKEAQARELVRFTKNTPIDIIAGDFNMLPDGAMKRSGFANPADVYLNDKTYGILKGLPLSEIVEHSAYLSKEETWFTFPSDRPDRRLDYIYHANRWPLIEAEVMTGAHAPASDHLPLRARFKFFDPEFIRD